MYTITVHLAFGVASPMPARLEPVIPIATNSGTAIRIARSMVLPFRATETPSPGGLGRFATAYASEPHGTTLRCDLTGAGAVVR